MPGELGEGHAAGHSRRRRRLPRGARAACNSSADKNSLRGVSSGAGFPRMQLIIYPVPKPARQYAAISVYVKRHFAKRLLQSEPAKLRWRGEVAIKFFAGVK